ncbi:hypothetical protein NUV89_10305 [Pseudomonas sp. 18.1.10]|uniref:DUF6630 family protein n=1 Tax=Pseudomonas sp. 18.1.10 TaxID=2969302 RepID=UPI00214F8B6D|nr:hypothetical protein [Pseudomonas sp. 18.1.10]MCR4538784.1 hypothetical protein [Pseudomonas sp. 18.1.10]
MGFLDRLFGGRFTMPPPDETNASHAVIMREMRSPESVAQKQALKVFTETLLARMPEAESARLLRRVLRKYAVDQDPASALTEGLLDTSRGQKLIDLVLLGVDFRGFDGFEYLAPLLVAASGVQTPYHYEHTGTRPMLDVLETFDQWLVGFDKRYLHLDSGDDDYVGFIVDADRVAPTLELARQAGLTVTIGSDHE